MQVASPRSITFLGGNQIPSVTQEPVKSQGTVFTSDLKDTAAQKATSEDLHTWLSAMASQGKFKAWIYQHRSLPQLLCPLLIYEVQITIVEGFERKISQFPCR